MESIKQPGSNGGIGESAARTADTAARTAHEAVDRAADAARPAVDRAASAAHETVDRLAGAANAAAGRVSGQADRLLSAEQQLADECRAYVRDNPLMALGGALAAGFILARLLGR